MAQLQINHGYNPMVLNVLTFFYLVIQNFRCGTPSMYANRTLYEVAASVEATRNCDLLFFDLFHTPSLPPASYSFGSSMTKKGVTNLFIIAGLLALFSVIATLILIRKFNYNSRLHIYRPLHKILQQKDTRLLSEENIQHM